MSSLLEFLKACGFLLIAAAIVALVIGLGLAGFVIFSALLGVAGVLGLILLAIAGVYCGIQEIYDNKGD